MALVVILEWIDELHDVVDLVIGSRPEQLRIGTFLEASGSFNRSHRPPRNRGGESF